MSRNESEVNVVLVTAPDTEVGRRIANALVGEGLAACVNIVPGIHSVYRWQGAVQEDSEVLLVVKTRADRLEALTERVGALHPYDLPEVLALSTAGGSAAYLDWVSEACAP